jgi:hypothetical protein
MSLIRVRAGFIATAAALVTLSACGSDSSSNPKPLTAAQLAAHYDSLALALDANGNHNDSVFSPNVALFNGIIADGVVPSSVQVTVGGTQQTWFGNSANWVDTVSMDSVQAVLLWSNTRADAFVGMIFIDTQGATNAFGVAARGGDFLADSTGTFTGTWNAPSGACSLTSITDVPLFLGALTTYSQSYGCSLQTATVSGTLISRQGDPTASAALQSITFTSQTIKGVRLVVPDGPAQHVPGGSLRAAIAATHGQPVFFRRR